jgi:2,4-dienoyl-CoA reductase-like NADH-dependent reductase (Old Yellow Enzyme family)
MASLFNEFRLKDVVLRNRIAVSPKHRKTRGKDVTYFPMQKREKMRSSRSFV